MLRSRPRRFAAGYVRQRGGGPLPERNGRQPVTAGRVMDTDTRKDAGRAASVNGRAAGDNPGWEGVRIASASVLTLPEVAALLGVSERQAHRLAKPYTLGLQAIYRGGREKLRQTYDGCAVRSLTLTRANNRCDTCGKPARAGAYTCGANRCKVAAYKARRAAYRGGR